MKVEVAVLGFLVPNKLCVCVCVCVRACVVLYECGCTSLNRPHERPAPSVAWGYDPWTTF